MGKKTGKFVRVEEMCKRPDIYVGIITKEDDEFFSGIFQGPMNDDAIHKRAFAKKEYKYHSVDAEKVKDDFEEALMDAERKYIDRKFSFFEAAKSYRNQMDIFKSIFAPYKPVMFEDVERL